MAADEREKPRKPKRRRRFGNIFSRKWASGRRTWSAVWYCKKEGRKLTRAFDTEKDAKDFLAEVEKRLLAETYEVPPTLSEVEEKEEQARAAVRKPRCPTLLKYAEDVIERRLDPVLQGCDGVRDA